MQTVRRSLGATTEAIVGVTAVQLGGLLSWAVGVSHGASLAVAGLVVQAALLVRWHSLRARRRDLCLELLVAGHGDPGAEELERECRRLRSPRLQARLAASLEDCATLGAGPHGPLELRRAIHNRRVLRAVVPQLRDVAARLRAGGAQLRGVAFLDQLLTAGSSPLYGQRVEPLRDQLTRARHLLG
jgi:hypothetical protein